LRLLRDGATVDGGILVSFTIERHNETPFPVIELELLPYGILTLAMTRFYSGENQDWETSPLMELFLDEWFHDGKSRQFLHLVSESWLGFNQKGGKVTEAIFKFSALARPLPERIQALVEVVKADAGATRLETVTEYVFYDALDIGMTVGIPTDDRRDRVKSQVTVLVQPFGNTVLAILQVGLTPFLSEDRPQLPQGYEVIGGQESPATLRRYLWPIEWGNETNLDQTLAEFAQKASEVYTIWCREVDK